MFRRLFSFADRRLLRKISQVTGRPPILLRLDNGATAAPPGQDAAYSLLIRSRLDALRLLLDPDVGFGEGYSSGAIRVGGELVPLLESIYEAARRAPPPGLGARLLSCYLDWIHRPTMRRARRNIHHHYDLGTDFYRLWLDPELVYTCAYFPTPDASLEEAQIAKMDLVCRKLQLQPGEKVVEAGCGWGSLALHMARHYGVTVKAFNISRDQIAYARRRAAAENLAGRVEFIEDDYRKIGGQFDAFVSIGMLEHVGKSNYKALAGVIRNTIGSGGRGLLHFIGRSSPAPLSAWIRLRIFPGAYVPTIGESARILEQGDYAILDVENLRLHYARTLERWLERYETSAARVAKMYDEEFVRAWRLYLAGSIAAFRNGTLQLFQVLFAGRDSKRIPWTREVFYSPAPQAERAPQWTTVMS
jgi:cyclopropane-fatty-acyl-phospholipid synthase